VPKRTSQILVKKQILLQSRSSHPFQFWNQKT